MPRLLLSCLVLGMSSVALAQERFYFSEMEVGKKGQQATEETEDIRQGTKTINR